MREEKEPSLLWWKQGGSVGSRGGVGGCTPQSTFVGRSSWGSSSVELIVCCQGTDTVEVAKWSGVGGAGGVVQCNCWLQPAFIELLCTGDIPTNVLFHALRHFSSDCWLQPACIEGLLYWDVTTNVLIRALRQSCPVSPRPPCQNQTRPPLPTLCGDLKLPFLQCFHLFLLSFKFLRLISMAELGQILALRWKRDTLTWVWGGMVRQVLFLWDGGPWLYSTSVTVEILCKLNLNLCCFKSFILK